MHTSPDSVGFQILRAIRRIIRRTSEYSREIGKSSGLSIPQMLCLKAVGEFSKDQRATGVEIAKVVQLSTATVSRILDHLDALGYLTRERAGEDRRRVLVSLTASGRTKLKRLPAPLHEQFLSRLNALSERRRKELQNALETIVELMDAGSIDAAPVLTPELEVDQNPSSERRRRT